MKPVLVKLFCPISALLIQKLLKNYSCSLSLKKLFLNGVVSSIIDIHNGTLFFLSNKQIKIKLTKLEVKIFLVQVVMAITAMLFPFWEDLKHCEK